MYIWLCTLRWGDSFPLITSMVWYSPFHDVGESHRKKKHSGKKQGLCRTCLHHPSHSWNENPLFCEVDESHCEKKHLGEKKGSVKGAISSLVKSIDRRSITSASDARRVLRIRRGSYRFTVTEAGAFHNSRGRV